MGDGPFGSERLLARAFRTPCSGVPRTPRASHFRQGDGCLSTDQAFQGLRDSLSRTGDALQVLKPMSFREGSSADELISRAELPWPGELTGRRRGNPNALPSSLEPERAPRSFSPWEIKARGFLKLLEVSDGSESPFPYGTPTPGWFLHHRWCPRSFGVWKLFRQAGGTLAGAKLPLASALTPAVSSLGGVPRQRCWWLEALWCAPRRCSGERGHPRVPPRSDSSSRGQEAVGLRPPDGSGVHPRGHG